MLNSYTYREEVAIEERDSGDELSRATLELAAPYDHALASFHGLIRECTAPIELAECQIRFRDGSTRLAEVSHMDDHLSVFVHATDS